MPGDARHCFVVGWDRGRGVFRASKECIAGAEQRYSARKPPLFPSDFKYWYVLKERERERERERETERERQRQRQRQRDREREGDIRERGQRERDQTAHAHIIKIIH